VSETPHSIDIEREIISAVLVSGASVVPERTAKAIETVEPDDFHDHRHRCLWRAIVQVYRDGHPPGDVTLVLEAMASQPLDTQAAREAMARALDSAGVSAHMAHYVKSLRGYRARRDIIDAAASSATLARSDAGLDEVVDEVERQLYAATRRAAPSSASSVSGLVRLHDERMIAARESAGGVTGIPTGLTTLSGMTGGLQPGWVVLVLAQAGMGKTAFAVNGLALSAARAGHHVHVFSLEQPGHELVGRMVAGCSGVPLNVQRRAMQADDMGRYLHGLDEVSRLPITVDDDPHCTVEQLRIRARRSIAGAASTPMVVVDYVQLLANAHARETEVERLAMAAKSCKAMAIELDAVVVLLAQPTTSSSRERRALHLEDVKGSQSMAAVADLALVPYRPWVFDKSSDKNAAEIHVRKFRHGDPGGLEGVRFRWNGARMAFGEV